MPLNLEQLDDEPILDRCPNFNGGVNSFSPHPTLDPNQLADLVNADTSVEGRLVTRRGTELVGTKWSYPVQAIGYFKTINAVTYPDNLVAIVSTDGLVAKFKVWDGAAWQAPIGAGSYTFGVPAVMVQGENYLYIAQAGGILSRWTGTAIQSLTGLGTANPPTFPTQIVWHTDRLICAGMSDDPEGLSMSQYLDGTTWDHANWDIAVGDGDGDPIVGLVSWTNFNLVVLKQHSVWLVNCSPALGNVADFEVTNVHRQIGCVAGRSAAQVGADVFFLSDSGVRGVARTLASDQQNTVGPPLSEPITNYINRINPAYYSSCVGYYWKNRYILAVPMDSSTVANFLFVYNTLTNSWSGYWTGWQPTCFTRRVHAGVVKLCFGQADGSITDFLDYVDEDNEVTATYQDQGVDYATTIISRGFTAGDDDALKTGLSANIEFNKSTAIANVSVILDSTDTAIASESFDTSSGTLSLPFDLPMDLPSGGILPKSVDLMQYGQWNHIQVKIASTAGKLSLNRMGIMAFQDTYMLQR